MATVHSFYLPPPEWQPPFTLTGAEAHHLARVLRIKAGHQVRLFDGQGRSGLFQVERVEKNQARLLPLSETTTLPPATRCTLAAGFSKALRRGWFLEKAVELGAHALWFWQGDFSQASLPDEEKTTWKASLIAGAKQCENTWLPDLHMLQGGTEALIARATEFDRVIVLYEGDTNGRILCKEDLAAPSSVLLIIGPEGGFSPQEIAAFTGAKLPLVSMGKGILRWETAAVLALGMAWWARQ